MCEPTFFSSGHSEYRNRHAIPDRCQIAHQEAALFKDRRLYTSFSVTCIKIHHHNSTSTSWRVMECQDRTDNLSGSFSLYPKPGYGWIVATQHNFRAGRPEMCYILPCSMPGPWFHPLNSVCYQSQFFWLSEICPRFEFETWLQECVDRLLACRTTCFLSLAIMRPSLRECSRVAIAPIPRQPLSRYARVFRQDNASRSCAFLLLPGLP